MAWVRASGAVPGGCPPRRVPGDEHHAARAIVREADVDSMNNLVYCDTTSGTPFGGDDSGDLPVSKSLTAKCEDGVNKLVGKAGGCIIKCHLSRASGKLA